MSFSSVIFVHTYMLIYTKLYSVVYLLYPMGLRHFQDVYCAYAVKLCWGYNVIHCSKGSA